ncbi:class A beta-lactamase [Paucibacter sp. APW11]|uniref:Beta-lactamase n=1 Tax=Roseateles aquae TaxID=3077235 RepID=A0ABU3P8P5_9BURK|nr:class A beta-lactamase [Paucibacter sp. APW11]MDT8998946.1 class A beta-lactamase [Paucibacter sp. APW11]
MANPRWTRRQTLWRLGCAASWLGSAAAQAAGRPGDVALMAAFTARCERLEQTLGGRIGFHAFALDGRVLPLGYREQERFALCSTFKLLLAAAVLAEVDAGRLRLDQRVPYGKADLVPHAPHTEQHLQRGWMSVEALCAAIMLASDNPAANLLLALLGGPAGLTRRCRDWGDPVTRLDRIEPELNSNLPGDERDTSTPLAMAQLMRHLLGESEALSPASRRRLLAWMQASETGLGRLRGGLPSNWRVGDKTGTGARGAVNDVLIAWPVAQPVPLLMTMYMSGSSAPTAALAAAHVTLAGAALQTWS